MFKAILPVEFDDGKVMYSAVLAMIQKVSPVLSAMIHDNPRYRPFSLVLPNRIHVLCPMLEQMIGGLDGIEIIEKQDYRELMHIQPDGQSIQFKFEKTFFRRYGNINLPIPDPFSILVSWKQRWNDIFPEKIEVEVPYPHETTRFPVHIVYANIVTHSYKIADYPTYTVFSGQVRLKSDTSFLNTFHTLARFAEFAGTGAKTTMGAGITRIVDGEGNEQKQERIS